MGVMKEVFFPHACLRYFQHQLGKQKFDGSGEKKSADHNATRIYCETWKQLIKNNNLADQIYNVDKIGGTKVRLQQVALNKIRIGQLFLHVQML